MNLRNAGNLIRQTVNAWSDDYASSMGAALAYYTMFSIAPLLLIVTAVSGYFFGADAARGEIFIRLRGLVGEDGAHAVEALINSAYTSGASLLATLIGVVALLIGATTVFAELQDALDRIWRVPVSGNHGGLLKFIHARLLSFVMIMAVSLLLMLSLVVSALLSSLDKWGGPLFADWEATAHIFDFIISVLLTTLMFAMIYKVVPRASIRWRDVWIGAAVTSMLFTLGKSLIGLYIGKSSVASGFGAAGSLVVVLLWVYYSAQIFLLGAEFTWVYAHAEGSRKGEPLLPCGGLPSRTVETSSADG